MHILSIYYMYNNYLQNVLKMDVTTFLPFCRFISDYPDAIQNFPVFCDSENNLIRLNKFKFMNINGSIALRSTFAISKIVETS